MLKPKVPQDPRSFRLVGKPVRPIERGGFGQPRCHNGRVHRLGCVWGMTQVVEEKIVKGRVSFEHPAEISVAGGIVQRVEGGFHTLDWVGTVRSGSGCWPHSIGRELDLSAGVNARPLTLERWSAPGFRAVRTDREGGLLRLRQLPMVQEGNPKQAQRRSGCQEKQAQRPIEPTQFLFRQRYQYLTLFKLPVSERNSLWILWQPGAQDDNPCVQNGNRRVGQTLTGRFPTTPCPSSRHQVLAGLAGQYGHLADKISFPDANRGMDCARFLHGYCAGTLLDYVEATSAATPGEMKRSPALTHFPRH